MLLTGGPPAPLRSSFGDDLFLRRHRGVGSPIANQLAWLFEGPLPAAGVEALADRLAEGALARRADRALVPGARGRWSRAAHRPAVGYDGEVAEHDVLAWLRARAGVRLDPAAGHGWELATADLASGGAVLSLVVSHAVADGGAMVDAVARAGAAAAPLVPPPRPVGLRALLLDGRDAVGQLAEVGAWLAGRLRPHVGPRPSGAPRPSAEPVATPSVEPQPLVEPVETPPDWTTPLVVLELAASDVDRVAAAHGGTVNAWFAALTAGVAMRVLGEAPVPVALPVSTRTPDDPRANATRIARVEVHPTDLARRDLAAVRARSRAAYAALDSHAREPLPLALVQMLPDAVVRRLPAPPGARALASRVGELPEAFVAAAGVPARSVAAIAHHVGAPVEEVRAIGGGIAAWSCTVGDRLTVSLAGMAPHLLLDDDALAGPVAAELARWDLAGRRWGTR
ncbi:hypothetical protein [Nocardioides sp. zg-DK7169]|uniref:hypothetical protein n=1 Tax=Nocardioides sp. zg-DK7169 TaxID=2736600 RepID=UPI001554C0A1|nr:hypothetical protein [Nocardioides sp. zg-DK7169]NPC96343.1 hypothetical protein [Nocardioides sp. zg-DK7169]